MSQHLWASLRPRRRILVFVEVAVLIHPKISIMDSFFTIFFFGASEPKNSKVEDVDIELADDDSSSKSGTNCVVAW